MFTISVSRNSWNGKSGDGTGAGSGSGTETELGVKLVIGIFLECKHTTCLLVLLLLLLYWRSVFFQVAPCSSKKSAFCLR